MSAFRDARGTPPNFLSRSFSSTKLMFSILGIDSPRLSAPVEIPLVVADLELTLEACSELVLLYLEILLLPMTPNVL